MGYAQLWHAVIFQSDFGIQHDESRKEEVISILGELSTGLSERLSDFEISLGEYSIPIEINLEPDAAVRVCEKTYSLEFPELIIHCEGTRTDMSMNITPSLGGKPSTKIMTVPNYMGTINDDVRDFFLRYRNLSNFICEKISNFYFYELGRYYRKTIEPFAELKKYDLFVYVIGNNTTDFKEYIRANNIKQKASCVDSDTRNGRGELRKSIQVLNYMRKEAPDEKYQWFVQKSGLKIGLYGFYGTEEEGNFIGITDDEPYEVTSTLVDGVLATV